MTFLEIQDAVMDSLNQTSTTARDRIKATINRRNGQVQTSVGLKPTRRTTFSGNTASGSSTMTVSGVLISNLVDRTVLDRPLGKRSLQELQNLDPAISTTGAPYFYAIEDINEDTLVLRLFPQPTAVNPLFAEVLDNATTLTADGDIPGWTADFHDILVHGTRGEELNRMEKSRPQARDAEQMFKDRLAEYRYFIAKQVYLHQRQTDGMAGLSGATVWPYTNVL